MMSSISRCSNVQDCVPQRWSLESIVHQATSHSLSQQQQINCMQSGTKRSSAPPEEMMTWNSFESPRSFKSAKITADDDSVHHDCLENQEGEHMRKGESSQSSARRSRAAAIHNLSERRRRDRINEKIKALQKLVPNASKTDKASMLEEVIEYLKQLQAQIHMMRNMPQPQMVMQQQLQMSLLAQMGMHAATVPLGGATPFVQPPFIMPPMLPPPSTPFKPNFDAHTDAYNTFLAQCMNMELVNNMSALYKQLAKQQTSKNGSTFTNS